SDIQPPTPDDFAEETPTKMDQVVATLEATYILKTEQRKDFVEFYDAIRRSDQTAFRIEFDKCDGEGATMTKRFELEATVRAIFHSQPNPVSIQHLLLATDLGAHFPWKFLIFPEPYISVSQYYTEVDKEDNTPQLAHRFAINSFLGIQMLHKVDIVHGDIRPENMFIGQNRHRRTVKIANFEHASSSTKEIPKGSELVNMTYASRGRMRNYEGCKKDDIESWIYCVAEFFHKELVPWHPDHNQMTPHGQPGHEKDMLKLKRAFCTRKLWKASREVLFPEFDQILQHIVRVSGKGEIPYDLIWNCLNSANLYLETNLFGIGAPWIKANQGAPTTPSSFLCTPIENTMEDYEGR
ncbi:hypothetical protein PENTCL1PPCAC_23077, partial [Pristionchus entomophagus]